ncbi:Hypothetical predicted protein, partial [Marmota monax]
ECAAGLSVDKRLKAPEPFESPTCLVGCRNSAVHLGVAAGIGPSTNSHGAQRTPG